MREYEIKLWEEVKVLHTLGGVPLEWGNGMPKVLRRGIRDENLTIL